MITVRRAQDRGHFDHGWLDTYHSFSFGEYLDPAFMGFRSLRVINEDCVKPGSGFPMHPHHDMEIITYILEGALEHKDSMGNGSVIRPGQIQKMSAGTGIRHSEFNPSITESVHLLQIWILPEQKGLTPGYEEVTLEADARENALHLIASPDGGKNIVTVRQDVKLYTGTLETGRELEHSIDLNRYAWLQLARGEIALNDIPLKSGDGATVNAENLLRIRASQPSEFLLFDLA